jgi:hypothetical protein
VTRPGLEPGTQRLRVLGRGRARLSADRAYEARAFIAGIREQGGRRTSRRTPTPGRRSAIDLRTVCHPGYSVSQVSDSRGRARSERRPPPEGETPDTITSIFHGRAGKARSVARRDRRGRPTRVLSWSRSGSTARPGRRWPGCTAGPALPTRPRRDRFHPRDPQRCIDGHEREGPRLAVAAPGSREHERPPGDEGPTGPRSTLPDRWRDG